MLVEAQRKKWTVAYLDRRDRRPGSDTDEGADKLFLLARKNLHWHRLKSTNCKHCESHKVKRALGQNMRAPLTTFGARALVVRYGVVRLRTWLTGRVQSQDDVSAKAKTGM
eukprot:scaffold104631_cov21-Prasinocladus_malaysianus.AAC.1